MKKKLHIALTAFTLAGVLATAGCGGTDPLADSGTSTPKTEQQTIVVGSQDYYSNEIIAEIYSQALESNGYTVDRQFRIGQREAYLPEIEKGSIDLFPEYTGNLLQYWQPEATAHTSEDVYAALKKATPAGLRVLDQSPATDQDSYTVTKAFANKWKLSSIADLANVTEPMTLGGNSELEKRPYGPTGLKSTYNVTVNFTPIEDQGGPLSVKALTDDTIQLANISTANPEIAANDLVSLKDPLGLFLASHVVPLASKKIDDKATKIINKVSSAMSLEDLISLNTQSTKDQESAAAIATAWLKTKNL